MDSFIQLVIAMLEKGISVELKFTPSNANAVKSIESSPAQPSQPIPSEDLKLGIALSKVLTEKELNDKDFKELDDLLYPESIDG